MIILSSCKVWCSRYEILRYTSGIPRINTCNSILYSMHLMNMIVKLFSTIKRLSAFFACIRGFYSMLSIHHISNNECIKLYAMTFFKPSSDNNTRAEHNLRDWKSSNREMIRIIPNNIPYKYACCIP